MNRHKNDLENIDANSSKSHSLPEVHRSVPTSNITGKFKKIFAFFGPAYLVSVGYMDPGNWATDIEGGARFGYSLLWVLLLSNVIAVLLQMLSVRLGIAAGKDLAQACREQYPRPVVYALWFLCEIAIAACDLAELLGSAIGLNLLFGIPMLWGVAITAVDVMILLAIQNLGVRKFEAFILSLVALVGLCFAVELFLSEPTISGIVSGFRPHLPEGALFVVIGIVGATVMPHNLYLHSALVQTRAFDPTMEGKKKALKFNFFDTVIALNAAFFVNAAILILAASVFYVNSIEVTELQQAHSLLSPLLGTTLAGTVFAIALLAAGQSSTLTGTLAGQIVMEGFLNFKMRPMLRRFLTRSIAIIPAFWAIATVGESGTYYLLILSQVILSMQLPFAIIPLIHFTSNKNIMGELAIRPIIRIAAWMSAFVVIGLNINLLIESTSEWVATSPDSLVLELLVALTAVALGLLLLYVSLEPYFHIFGSKKEKPHWRSILEEVVEDIHSAEQAPFKHIAVALAHDESDKAVMRHAVSLATRHNANLTLIHVVVGAVGTIYGKETYDAETKADEEYLHTIAEAVKSKNISVAIALGYGSIPKEIIRLVKLHSCDALVMGGHGHRGLKDIFFGATISPVRHDVKIPVIVARE